MESLRGMVNFVQVARLGSFAKAAEQLGVSAVAVSKNVSRLEQQLGVRLFARSTRHLGLTPEGSALLERCELPLAQLADAFAGSRKAAEEAEGVVRITSVTPFVRNYLAPHLAAFHRRHPNVVLQLECSEHISNLIADRNDIGIRIGSLDNADFVARPLGPLALPLCVAPALLARVQPLTTPEAVAQRHALGLQLTGSADVVPWRLQGKQGLRTLPVAGPLRCNDMAALAAACVAGLGVAQLPLVSVLAELKSGQLQVLWPEQSPRGLQLFMHYPNRNLPARVRVVVEFLLDCARAHPDLALEPQHFAVRPAVMVEPVEPAAPAAAPRRRSRAAA
jgi:DNA-binding transcriptional LysR family regulator